MQRLSEALLHNKLSYARGDLDRGLVHIGVGGFHRAHQAFYTEQVLNSGDLRWGTVGASLNSTRARDSLAPQDFLYTLSTRDSDKEELNVHGGLLDIVSDEAALIDVLSNPSVQVVTLTITEKGYMEGEGVAAVLAKALAARKALDAPLTLLSCDNLTGNGQVLRRCVTATCDDELQAWMNDRVAFPNTMVDRITPQTTDADLARIAELAGYHDAAPVVCEPFCQWVIEDDFRGDRPEWEIGGAMFVSDAAPYEQAKLRMLNASHSLFAYLGLLKGYEYVHEAAADTQLSTFVLDALALEIVPNIEIPVGMDAEDYVRSIMQRFLNSAVPYRTAQVASDGSAKMPQRIYPTAQSMWSKGQAAPRLELAICAWLKSLIDHDYSDPGAADIRSAGKEHLVAEVHQKTDHWHAFPKDVIPRLDKTLNGLLENGLTPVLSVLRSASD